MFLNSFVISFIMKWSWAILHMLIDHLLFIYCQLSSLRRRQWHPTPVLLLWKSHGRWSLVGCSPWGHEESDTTERLHFHFSLSCIGGGNSNPLQCSCLEKPRDGRAWWAAVHGVAQSRTQLKRLSSSKLLQNKSVCLSQGPPCLSHHNYSITAIKIIFLYTLSICYNGF